MPLIGIAAGMQLRLHLGWNMQELPLPAATGRHDSTGRDSECIPVHPQLLTDMTPAGSYACAFWYNRLLQPFAYGTKSPLSATRDRRAGQLAGKHKWAACMHPSVSPIGACPVTLMEFAWLRFAVQTAPVLRAWCCCTTAYEWLRSRVWKRLYKKRCVMAGMFVNFLKKP